MDRQNEILIKIVWVVIKLSASDFCPIDTIRKVIRCPFNLIFVENILREWQVIMIFSTIFTRFGIFIAAVSTQNVTELAISVKAIDTLAAIVTLPTISPIKICGSFKEFAVNFFVRHHHTHIRVDYTVLS